MLFLLNVFLQMIVIFIVFGIFIFLLEKGINKLLGVERKKLSETSGKRVDRSGNVVIGILSMVAIPFLVHEPSFFLWHFILIWIVAYGFKAIMEWKYVKNSKQYVATLILLIIGIPIIYYMVSFIQQIYWL